MASIRKIEDSLIPKDAIVCKNGMKTKKIYLKKDVNEFFVFYNNFSVENGSILIASNETESIKTRKEYSDKIGEWVYIDLFNADTRIAYERVGDIIRSNSYPNGSYLIEFDEPITIAFDLNRYFYCIPEKTIELKPMPKIDKLIDSSTFENVSTKLQEINDLLKVSSDNLKTIMDANNLMYDITDNFSTLVQKLNNEPINFLLEGTKVRDILRKHMGTMIYAPDAGATYNDLMFTDSLPSDAQDLKEDLSQKQDGSILLLKKSISDGSRTYDTYYIYSNKKIYANKNSSYMFNLGVNYFSDIYFNNFYGEYIENASHLFDYVTYSNASAVYVTLNKFENVILNNLVNIDYMFNDCAIKLNRSITITNKIKTYNNFYSKFNSYQESYGSITLNYIDNESKKIAETIVSETNDSFIKLGSLVTQ